MTTPWYAFFCCRCLVVVCRCDLNLLFGRCCISWISMQRAKQTNRQNCSYQLHGTKKLHELHVHDVVVPWVMSFKVDNFVLHTHTCCHAVDIVLWLHNGEDQLCASMHCTTHCTVDNRSTVDSTGGSRWQVLVTCAPVYPPDHCQLSHKY